MQLAYQLGRGHGCEPQPRDPPPPPPPPPPVADYWFDHPQVDYPHAHYHPDESSELYRPEAPGLFRPEPSVPARWHGGAGSGSLPCSRMAGDPSLAGWAPGRPAAGGAGPGGASGGGWGTWGSAPTQGCGPASCQQHQWNPQLAQEGSAGSSAGNRVAADTTGHSLLMAGGEEHVPNDAHPGSAGGGACGGAAPAALRGHAGPHHHQRCVQALPRWSDWPPVPTGSGSGWWEGPAVAGRPGPVGGPEPGPRGESTAPAPGYAGGHGWTSAPSWAGSTACQPPAVAASGAAEAAMTAAPADAHTMFSWEWASGRRDAAVSRAHTHAHVHSAPPPAGVAASAGRPHEGNAAFRRWALGAGAYGLGPASDTGPVGYRPSKCQRTGEHPWPDRVDFGGWIRYGGSGPGSGPGPAPDFVGSDPRRVLMPAPGGFELSRRPAGFPSAHPSPHGRLCVLACVQRLHVSVVCADVCRCAFASLWVGLGASVRGCVRVSRVLGWALAPPSRAISQHHSAATPR